MFYCQQLFVYYRIYNLQILRKSNNYPWPNSALTLSAAKIRSYIKYVYINAKWVKQNPRTWMARDNCTPLTLQTQ